MSRYDNNELTNMINSALTCLYESAERLNNSLSALIASDDEPEYDPCTNCTECCGACMEDDSYDEEEYCTCTINDLIDHVILKDPYTIVFWKDGDVTRVKCSKNDTYDPEKGLSMAIIKKAFGNRYYRDIVKVINTKVVEPKQKISKNKSKSKTFSD